VRSTSCDDKLGEAVAEARLLRVSPVQLHEMLDLLYGGEE
jgi:hypothetical protein